MAWLSDHVSDTGKTAQLSDTVVQATYDVTVGALSHQSGAETHAHLSIGHRSLWHGRQPYLTPNPQAMLGNWNESQTLRIFKWRPPIFPMVFR